MEKNEKILKRKKHFRYLIPFKMDTLSESYGPSRSYNENLFGHFNPIPTGKKVKENESESKIEKEREREREIEREKEREKERERRVREFEREREREWENEREGERQRERQNKIEQDQVTHQWYYPFYRVYSR